MEERKIRTESKATTNERRGRRAAESGEIKSDACRHSFKQKTVRTPASVELYEIRFHRAAKCQVKRSELCTYANYSQVFRLLCVQYVHGMRVCVSFHLMFSFRFYSLIEWQKEVYMHTESKTDRRLYRHTHMHIHTQLINGISRQTESKKCRRKTDERARERDKKKPCHCGRTQPFIAQCTFYTLAVYVVACFSVCCAVKYRYWQKPHWRADGA